MYGYKNFFFSWTTLLFVQCSSTFLPFNQRLIRTQSVIHWFWFWFFLVWTHVCIIGHGLSIRLDEFGHWVVWIPPPELFPQSLLPQGFPGCLSLDQGNPAPERWIRNQWNSQQSWKSSTTTSGTRDRWRHNFLYTFQPSVEEIRGPIQLTDWDTRRKPPGKKGRSTTSSCHSRYCCSSHRVLLLYATHQGCVSKMPFHISSYHSLAGDKKSAR